MPQHLTSFGGRYLREAVLEPPTACSAMASPTLQDATLEAIFLKVLR